MGLIPLILLFLSLPVVVILGVHLALKHPKPSVKLAEIKQFPKKQQPSAEDDDYQWPKAS